PPARPAAPPPGGAPPRPGGENPAAGGPDLGPVAARGGSQARAARREHRFREPEPMTDLGLRGLVAMNNA
ncbi:hypothetical protein MXD63_00360, partial [Frankia sp. Cpl3]|nr:hypothetical protein [Frankia sp. Cpl3]